MKYLFLTLILTLFFSCGNEKVLQLPEIDYTEITEISDVSAAYVFYDETKPDSTEFNRKNLISTTNWLFNVDKRLTLKQAIPSIIFLQNKKRDAQIHKNENAKNYFTCHYKKINNLGFIEFTNIYYHEETIVNYLSKKNIKEYHVISFNSKNILINNKPIKIEQLITVDTISNKIFLKFDKHINFQKYISYKEQLTKIDTTQINIDNNEFIY